MAHIYIYSPSGAVRDRAAFRRGLQCLRALGHEVEVDADALARVTRFAGDDETRLAALHRAAASGADVALISRGGYGLTRILAQVRLRELARAVQKGTRFVGMSDFTALQLAMLAKTGATSWSGPSLGEDFGRAEPDDITLACFDDLVSGQGEGTGWRLPRAHAQAPSRADGVWAKNATLWGGNLTVLTALLGTPYFPQVRGGILYLEDIAEHPYRIERMLTQLLHAGVLGAQKAIVLGQFTDYKLGPHDRGFNFAQVVNWLRAQVKAPVLTGLPFGHVPTKVCLPTGLPVSLVVEGQDALLLWAHEGH